MKNGSDKQRPLHLPTTDLATLRLLFRFHTSPHPVEFAERRSKVSDLLLTFLTALPSAHDKYWVCHVPLCRQRLSTTVPIPVHRSSRKPCITTTRTKEAGARHPHVEEHNTSQSRSRISRRDLMPPVAQRLLLRSSITIPPPPPLPMRLLPRPSPHPTRTIPPRAAAPSNPRRRQI